MKISQELYKELRRLTRAAQRRMERATPGQRRSLEYLTKRATGETKWSSAAAGMTTQQAKAQIAKLEKFLASPYTTKRGWAAEKAENVRKAQEKLARRRKGFNLTDKELGKIFEEVTEKFNISDEELAELQMSFEEALHKEKYRVINLITASKEEGGNKFKVNATTIADAMADKATAAAAYERARKARKRIVKAQNDEGADIPF